MTPGLFRCLIAPGEAWIRLVALLCGASVATDDGMALAVTCQTRGTFALGISADRTLLQIEINGQSTVVNRDDAEKIERDLADAITEMAPNPEPTP